MSDDELFELLITGQLQPSDPAVVGAFLERPELASRWQELQDLQQVLTHAGSAGAPEALAADRVERVQRLVRAKLPPRQPWLLPVLLAAAAVLIGAGLLLWQQQDQPPPASTDLFLGGDPSSPEPSRLLRDANTVVRWPNAHILGEYTIEIRACSDGRVLHTDKVFHGDEMTNPSYRLNVLATTLPKETLWNITWKNGDLEPPLTRKISLVDID